MNQDLLNQMNLLDDNKIKNEIIELASDLIKFKTVASNEQELKNIIDFTENYLKSNKLITINKFKVNDKYNLIAKLSDEVKVYFVVHLDVVDAEESQFNPYLDGNRLVGRGALDMKGPASVVLYLFKNINKSLPIGLIATTDEEVGSLNGVKYITENMDIKADVAVIPDGGEDFNIITKGKGAFHFRVKSYGKSAHGSTTWLGINAIDKLLKFYDELKNIVLEQEENDNIHWHNTINLGKIEGGVKVNVVPDYAYADIDIRFTEKYTLDNIYNLVDYLVRKNDLELEVLSTGQPVSIDLTNKYLQKFIDSYKRVIGEPRFSVEHGATDGRFFAAKNIPVITIYPIGQGLHSNYEWVDVDSLVILFKLFFDFVFKIE
jgi:acetylornithine deacetylase/succinyl-diaminopimelate desuccinylase-like protein